MLLWLDNWFNLGWLLITAASAVFAGLLIGLALGIASLFRRRRPP